MKRMTPHVIPRPSPPHPPIDSLAYSPPFSLSPTMRGVSWRAFVTLMLLVLPLVVGCGGPSKIRRVPTASSDKMSLIREVRQRYATEADAPVEVLRHLVEELNSDDRAVRMMAIHTLEKLTGTRLDFDPYAKRHQREPAMQRWRDRYRSPRL